MGGDPVPGDRVLVRDRVNFGQPGGVLGLAARNVGLDDHGTVRAQACLSVDPCRHTHDVFGRVLYFWLQTAISTAILTAHLSK